MDMQQARNDGWSAVRTRAISASSLAFLKKVYGLFAASVGCSALGALVALSAGAESSQLLLRSGSEVVAVPPLVAFFAQHWFVGMLLTVGAVFGASHVRHEPRVNVLALFGMATLFGVVLAPALFFAQIAAGMGGTLSTSPVRDTFLLSASGFAGLSGYAALSRKDFSYLRGALTMGLFVVIGAMILNLFIGSSAFGLALSSVGVLLFGGFILYDTSRILNSGERDAVGGAISLYLDFINLFLSLLRILSARRG